jgi:hypothetical protein
MTLNAFRQLPRLLLLLAAVTALSVTGQESGTARNSHALPAAGKIIGDYLKAVGGKKKIAGVRDATYEYSITGESSGTAKVNLKAPSSLKIEIHSAERTEMQFAVSGNSVWAQGADGSVRTITDRTANDDRLLATLLASRMVDFGKLNILARTTGIEQNGSVANYLVEFSMRNGARVIARFDAITKLPVSLKEAAGDVGVSFSNYQSVESVLEPQVVTFGSHGGTKYVLRAGRSTRNTALAQSIFDPPSNGEGINIPALLSEIQANQKKIDERVSEYYYLQKQTEREIDDKGQLKKEEVKVYEVFPVPGRESVLKLISENGVALSPEKAAKEEKRVGEELEKAERDRLKDKEKAEKRAQEGKTDDRDPGISTFLRVCELVSPRKERIGNRDAVVFDFRPKPGLKPKNREESLVSKLIGTVWIDPQDKEVIRLEAKFAEGFKVGGGLVLSLKPGAAFVMEQARQDDGVWLPRFAQANLSFKLFLVGGGNVNNTIEWSNYRRVSGEASGYQINSPANNGKPVAPPE